MQQQSQQSGQSSIVDFGAHEANVIANAIAPKQMQILTTISTIIIILLGWLSVVLEVFLRHNFGERYLSIFRLFFAYHLLGLFWLIPTAISLNSFDMPTQNSPFIGIFTLAFLVMSVYHHINIWVRYKKRIAWHSRSFGISRLHALPLPAIPIFGQGDWALYRFYEPALCFIIGFLLINTNIDASTGFVISVASAALFMKNNMIYYQHRARILDLIDARIEGMYFNEEAFQKKKEDLAGMFVMDVVFPKTTTDNGGNFDQTVLSTMGGYASINDELDESPSPATSTTDFSSTVQDTMTD